MQDERQLLPHTVPSYLEVFAICEELSSIAAPSDNSVNDKLTKLIKDIVYSPKPWLKSVTRHIYLTWVMFRTWCEHPSDVDFDLSGELRLVLTFKHGFLYGAEALQYIDRSVKKFRKN